MDYIEEVFEMDFSYYRDFHMRLNCEDKLYETECFCSFFYYENETAIQNLYQFERRNNKIESLRNRISTNGR